MSNMRKHQTGERVPERIVEGNKGKNEGAYLFTALKLMTIFFGVFS